MRRQWLHKGCVAAAGLALVVGAWLHPGLGNYDDTIAQSAASPASGDLSGLLEQVQVVDLIGPVTGYERGCRKGQGCVFGPAWNDPLDKSGCDTRNRLLAQQLHDVVFKPGTRNCKVIAGWLQDPYTGEIIDLADVEIDHILPLRRAWDGGAWQWDLLRRKVFANDPIELLAVSGQANQSKGDSGLDEWLPPSQPDRCPYVIRYLTVAVKYQLPITNSERMTAISACQ